MARKITELEQKLLDDGWKLTSKQQHIMCFIEEINLF